MKKLTIILLLTGTAMFTNAQQSGFSQGKALDNAQSKYLKTLAFSNIQLGWINPSYAVYNNYWAGVGANDYSNLVFPDSTVKLISIPDNYYNWTMSIGQVFDPYSKIFDQNLSTPLMNSHSSYKIDTISVNCQYQKYRYNMDTLVYEIVYNYDNYVSNTFKNYMVLPSGNIYDTMYFSAPKMHGDAAQFGYKALLSDPNKIVFKYVLQQSDSVTSLNSWKTVKLPVNLTIPYGMITGVSITFKPGYSYSFGDTIINPINKLLTSEINSFRFHWLFEDTYPYSGMFYDPYGKNMSYLITTKGRYTTYPNGDTARNNNIMQPYYQAGIDIGWKVEEIPAAPEAGIATAETPICAGDSTTLTLSYYFGSIQWQESSDSINWLDVSGGYGENSNIYITEPLFQKTYYRAEVNNGDYAAVYSPKAKVTVNPLPVGGTATAITPLCANHVATLTLSGYTGDILWEQSIGGSGWTIASGGSDSTLASYTSDTLTVTSYFRARVSNQWCDTVYSVIDTVEVLQSPEAEICYVEFDSVNIKNNIIWTDELPANADSVHIYREISLDDWLLIGKVLASETHFVDMGSSPQNQSYSYRIAIVDTCNNESAKSDFHTSITLLASYDQLSNTYGFTWSPYLGLTVYDYFLYGADENDVLREIASVPGNQTFYNYINPDADYVKYCVAFETPECASKKMHSIRSNWVQKTTGIADNTEINNQIILYPNPVKDAIYLQSDLQITKCEITDITGRILLTSNQKRLDCRALSNGVYFIKVETEKGVAVKRFVKE